MRLGLEDSAVAHPVFWKKAGEGWLYRTMFEEIPLPLDWPVYVSHAEAAAYARWAGRRSRRKSNGTAPPTDSRMELKDIYPWGDEAPDPSLGNFDFSHWDPDAGECFSARRQRFRRARTCWAMVGNGPPPCSRRFPASRPFPFYRGYSANFFDGKHFVMKGDRRALPRACCVPHFATGSRRITNTFTRDSAACRIH